MLFLKVRAFIFQGHAAVVCILPIGKTIIKVGFVSAWLQVTDFRVCFVMMLPDERIRVSGIKQARRKASERVRRAQFLCLSAPNGSRIAFSYFVLSNENQRLLHPSLPCLLPCFINVSPQYCPLSYTSNLLSLSF